MWSFQHWGLYKPSSSAAMKKKWYFRNLEPFLPYMMLLNQVSDTKLNGGGGGGELEALPL